MGQIINLWGNTDVAHDAVTLSANTASALTDVVVVKVPATLSYKVFDSAVIILDLDSASATNLPDNASVEIWVEDPDGSDKKRVFKGILNLFNQITNKADRDQQIRLRLSEDVVLPELHYIRIKVNSTAVVDWTFSSFELEIEQL